MGSATKYHLKISTSILFLDQKSRAFFLKPELVAAHFTTSYFGLCDARIIESQQLHKNDQIIGNEQASVYSVNYVDYLQKITICRDDFM